MIAPSKSLKSLQFLCLSLVFLAVSFYLMLLIYQSAAWCMVINICYGILSLLMAILGLACLEIFLLQPSNTHSYSSLLIQYLYTRAILIVGYYMFRQFTKASKDVKNVQERFLLTVLAKHASTTYGEDYDFESISSREDFKTKHPLTVYDHYEPYVDRILNGEENILFEGHVDYIAMTSGTTGHNKKVPYNKKDFTFAGLQLGFLSAYRIFSLCPELKTLKKRVEGIVAGRLHKSENGITMGPVSRLMMSSWFQWFTSPPENQQITNEKDALYIHLLFGLREKHAGTIGVSIATLAINFFRTLQDHWEELADDIEFGQLNSHVDLPVDLRKRLVAMLRPDPVRAEEIRIECSKGFINIVERLWPDIKGVQFLTTGSYKVYTDLIRPMTGKIPIVSPIHISTECFLGFNLNPGSDPVCYTCLPGANFYEFLPEDQFHAEDPKTVFMDQVTLGGVYEMVITNNCGLVRYRMGDVIKVVDFYNEVPIYEYLYRLGQLLEVYFEKTPESIFYEAMNECSQQLGVCLVDYTSVENAYLAKMKGETPESRYYVLFIEIQKEGLHYQLSKEECQKFDDNLCELFDVYKNLREQDSIDPIHVVQVKPGAFRRLKQYILKLKPLTSAAQFKMPRVMRNEDFLQFLLDEALM